MRESRLFGWSLPPGVSQSTLDRQFEEGPMWPDVRCSCCGAFICYSVSAIYPPTPTTQKALSEEIQHFEEYECPGAKAFSGGEVGLCGDQCDGPHTVREYAGVTQWYRCSYCGAETAVNEF